MPISRPFLALLLGLALVLQSSSCEKSSPPDDETFSPAEQKIIGQRINAAILADPNSFGLLNPTLHPCPYDYAEGIVAQLLQSSHISERTRFDWELRILQGNRTDAFTLPGGYLYIGAGLLNGLLAEHELAALLAHEMAYADLGLASERLVAEYGGAVMADILTDTDNPTASPASIAAAMPGLGYGASSVAEADAFALSVICPFTYSATGLQDILARPASAQWAWRQSKPDYPDRSAELEASAAGCTGTATFAPAYAAFLDCLP